MKTTFPLIKLWSEGPILTNFWCPTTLLLWVEKKLLVKNDRKWHFLEFFQLAIGISQPLPTLIFPLWYSLPTLIPNFQKCHFWPFFTNKIFSTHKSKVVGHQKLVNIGTSDQSFISGKVVLFTNNPAEESQVISFRSI